MDLVLLVVAADEGIMPQTREHMDIFGLLGIKKSILVITKCDLVDEDGWNSLRKKSRKNWKVLFWKVHRLLKYRLQPGRGLMN